MLDWIECMNSNFPSFCPGLDEAMILVEENLRNLRVRWVLQGRKFANNSWVNCGEVTNLGRWSGRDFAGGWRRRFFG